MDYIKESARTASESYHGHKVSMHTFLRVCGGLVLSCEQLTTIKNALFYGRDSDFLKHDVKLGEWNMEAAPIQLANGLEPTQDERDIIHAIVGKITEAGELLEILVNTLQDGKELDVVAIREEVGDSQWFDAMLLRAIGSNFEEVQEINIAKLKKRFPEKFTEHEANNRDLVEERKILENK